MKRKKIKKNYVDFLKDYLLVIYERWRMIFVTFHLLFGGGDM